MAVGLAVVFPVGVARAEVVVRKASEGDDDFMARVLGPSVELAQKVVRSSEIAGGKLTLIGFVNIDDDPRDPSDPKRNPEANTLVGHLLIERSPGRYEHVKFPSCEEAGGAPELAAVFFARTVKGGGRDLAVLCSWEHGGPMSIVNSLCYSAQFYRLKDKGPKMVVEPVSDLENKFDTCDVYEPNEQGKWIHKSKPKFTTVAEVKKLLTQMGFKQ